MRRSRVASPFVSRNVRGMASIKASGPREVVMGLVPRMHRTNACAPNPERRNRALHIRVDGRRNDFGRSFQRPCL